MEYGSKKILPFIRENGLIYKVCSVIILIIVGYLSYNNIFDNSFHFDDSVWKTLDQVQNKDYLGLFDFNVFRVIPFATFTHNYHLFGTETSGYFIINLTIHIINSILCFSFLLLLFKTPTFKEEKISYYAPIIALFGALIFLAHPIQTQAVAYVYQRLASMAAMFYLATCVFYLSARLSDKKFKKIIYFILVFISFILALFTKENSFTLPLMIGLFEVILINREIKIKPYLIIILLLLIAALFLLVNFALGFENIFFEQETTYGDRISSENYLLTQFRVINTYWRLLFLPYGQHLDYYFPLSESIFDFHTLSAFLIHLIILSIAVYTLRKHRLISFGIIWFYLTLLIESSIIPIRDVIFEHRLYLPIVGFIMIIMYLAFKFLNKKHLDYVIIFFIALTVFYSYLTYQRNRVWQNEGTLWTDSIRKSTMNSRAWNNRGLYFLKNDKYEVAIHNFTKSIELKPTYVEPYSNRGTAYFFLQKYSKSLDDFNKCIELDPSIPDTYLNRSNIHMVLNDYKAAIKDLNILKIRRPDDSYSYMGLARCYRELKNWDKAIENYEKYLEFDKKSIPTYINLAICYSIIDSIDKSIDTYSKGIENNPDNPKLMFRKADLLMQIGRHQESYELFLKVKEIDPNYKGLNERIDSFED